MLAARKKDWILTPEAFARLLAALDPDRERAGLRYENIRRKLIEFFEARGSNSPADNADETINRVARRLARDLPERASLTVFLLQLILVRLLVACRILPDGLCETDAWIRIRGRRQSR